jgi:demethylmacrocin O-methyltransferase
MLSFLQRRLGKYTAGLSDTRIKQARALEVTVSKLFGGSNLVRLARLLRCDKMYNECLKYGPYYDWHFRRLRRSQINVLEIGIGGYANRRAGGSSLRLWKAYFKRAQIFGIDLADGRLHEQARIKTFQGDQGDRAFLQSVADRIGTLNIVIDDGSHLNEHVISTFETLFPRLAPDGIYVVEDTQASYWRGMGGDSMDFNNPGTSMGFFKRLVDGLNYQEFERDAYEPTYYDRNITQLHFYHNLIFIYKGRNLGESNILGRRWS